MNRPLRKRWRSLLFVPADKPKLLQRAPTRGADALIIDLEDAVDQANKAQARAALASSAGALAEQGASVLVRINNDPDLVELDLAALPASAAAVVIPKAESLADLAAVSAGLERREAELGLAAGAIGLVPLIESPKGLRHAYEIAEDPRVVGVALGTEDFALALGVEPRPEALTLPAQIVCLAAAAAGVMGLALPQSIANFRDVDLWAAGVRAGRALGATGALCVHPAQVPALNRVFSVSAEEKAWAEAVVEAWARAGEGTSGVVALDGQMIDEPVLRRARATLKAIADL